MASVRFEHINKSFGNVEVVHDLNLTVNDHEFVVLVGPSGSGKSTILRMVAGLDEPSGGNLYIGDRLVNGVEPKDRDIAMVFQSCALYLLWWLLSTSVRKFTTSSSPSISIFATWNASKEEAEEFYSPLQNNSLTHTRKTGASLQSSLREAMREMC